MAEKKYETPIIDAVAKTAEKAVKEAADIVTTTIRLNAEVWRKAKEIALKEGLSLSKLINKKLEELLGQKEGGE